MPPVRWTTSVTIARSESTWSMACRRCSLQTETRKRKNSESTNHSTIPVRKGMMGTGLGERRRTASSMTSRTIRIRMRTFTSQVSQFRSSEMECMKVSLQQKCSSPSLNLAIRVERLPFDQMEQVRHLIRAVAEGIGPGGFLDILVVNVRVRMIKTNGAFEPKLHGTVGEARDVQVVAERIRGPPDAYRSG